jgi:hypothetical protein
LDRVWRVELLGQHERPALAGVDGDDALELAVEHARAHRRRRVTASRGDLGRSQRRAVAGERDELAARGHDRHPHLAGGQRVGGDPQQQGGVGEVAGRGDGGALHEALVELVVERALRGEVHRDRDEGDEQPAAHRDEDADAAAQRDALQDVADQARRGLLVRGWRARRVGHGARHGTGRRAGDCSGRRGGRGVVGRRAGRRRHGRRAGRRRAGYGALHPSSLPRRRTGGGDACRHVREAMGEAGGHERERRRLRRPGRLRDGARRAARIDVGDRPGAVGRVLARGHCPERTRRIDRTRRSALG